MNDLPTSGGLAYVKGRVCQKAYDLLIREIKRTGMSLEDLAERSRVPLEEVQRLTIRPRSAPLDTYSALLYALGGGSITFSLEWPIKSPPSPDRQPSL